MKKYILSVMVSSLLSVLLISCGGGNSPLASVNGEFIYKKDLSSIDKMQRIMYGENDVLEGNLLFDRIKDMVFISLSKKIKTGYSDSSVDEYINGVMMAGHAPAYVMDIFKKSGKHDFKKYFLSPYISANMFSDFTSSDTLIFQKKQYEEAMSILMKWKAKDADDYKNFISSLADYFEKSIGEEEFSSFSPTHMKDDKMLIEDMDYFYTIIYKDGRIRGFMIKKSPIDSALVFLKDSIDVKINSPSYERSLQKITEGTVWNSLIFK